MLKYNNINSVQDFICVNPIETGSFAAIFQLKNLGPEGQISLTSDFLETSIASREALLAGETDINRRAILEDTIGELGEGLQAIKNGGPVCEGAPMM